jgi:hypothetical protein
MDSGHGHAQFFGWFETFVMGISYSADSPGSRSNLNRLRFRASVKSELIYAAMFGVFLVVGTQLS